jgi:hypothetical protein
MRNIHSAPFVPSAGINARFEDVSHILNKRTIPIDLKRCDPELFCSKDIGWSWIGQRNGNLDSAAPNCQQDW